jgi:hypothetical protein
MIVGPLPEVGVRSGSDGNGVAAYFEGSRFPGPPELVKADLPAGGKGFGHAVNKFSVRCFSSRITARNCQDG